METNPVWKHMVSNFNFLFYVLVAGIALYLKFLLGRCFYDRRLRKKAWLARQKTGAARLERLIIRRKIY